MKEIFHVQGLSCRDEIVVREGIRKSIPWEQYGFMYAGDASDGELRATHDSQDRTRLIITDIKMPFMDGLSLIELVQNKDLPMQKSSSSVDMTISLMLSRLFEWE